MIAQKSFWIEIIPGISWVMKARLNSSLHQEGFLEIRAIKLKKISRFSA